MSKYPEVLSTGKIAKICGFSSRTVTKWIDDGRLEGSRGPGGHRRVAKKSLIIFMKEHGMESLLPPELKESERPV